VETAWLDRIAYCTPWSSLSILLYIASCLASYFFVISSIALFIVVRRKLKSSGVSVVFILVTRVLGFFREEGFRGETFLFFDESSSSSGLCSTSSSLPSCSGEMDAVLTDLLSISYISSSFFIFVVFFILLGPGVSCAASGLLMSDNSVGSTETRSFFDHSLVISSRYSSFIL
jgi:hypothetical protein